MFTTPTPLRDPTPSSRFAVISNGGSDWLLYDRLAGQECVVCSTPNYSLIQRAQRVFAGAAAGWNPDAVPADALEEFYVVARRSPRALARVLWGREDDEAKRVLFEAVDYCERKAAAIRLRDGDAATARALEGNCETIYAGLPAWARW